MADRTDGRTWGMRAAFLLLAFVLIVIALVPLDMRPSSFAGPDLLQAATLAWVARRPKVAPILMIACIFLMADLLFMRPPGLFAALVVLLTETIRRRNAEFRNMPFAVEWATIAGGIVLITLINRIILFVVAVPRAPLGLTLIELVMTILAYPLVVVVAYFLFGLRRAAPGETGRKGQLI